MTREPDQAQRERARDITPCELPNGRLCKDDYFHGRDHNPCRGCSIAALTAQALADEAERTSGEEEGHRHKLRCDEYHAHVAPKCCAEYCWCRPIYQRARNDVLEEAAQVAVHLSTGAMRQIIGDAIRALKKPSEEKPLCMEKYTDAAGSTDTCDKEKGHDGRHA